MLTIIPVHDLTADEPLDLSSPSHSLVSSSSSTGSSASIFSSATVGDYESATSSVESSTSPEITILNERKAPTPTAKPTVSKLLKHENTKTVFVEALVGSAVLLVDAIWKNPGGSSKKSMPLRRFIQETLKRSRTSYSTFQVSLYYLILVKPFIFEQARQKRLAKSPLSCARRTFLASLMLASKCLQDRNYSISAWSKISGLSVKELGNNEIEFLKAADWKLHVPQEVYNRWSTLLLSSGSVKPETWKNRIKTIGPDIKFDECSYATVWGDFIDLTATGEDVTSGYNCSTGTSDSCDVTIAKVSDTSPVEVECDMPLTPEPTKTQFTPPQTGAYYMTNRDEWRYIRSSLAIKQKLQTNMKALQAKQRSVEAVVLATPAPSEVRLTAERKRSFTAEDDEAISIVNVRSVKRRVIHVDGII
ncbi:Pcl5p [Sugiyamaella lignohabitans]|uniref:Pcl5p n=1 Tax=Sugiyamaella lignohabitans TaxID=796027 RepID=A0A167CUS4_9ASCO|nr:Pcl5p [Sugiyamaella lignohabitans]ANB12130.1 Pcl5p [Sugiyamaella lignohabitans]